MANIRVGILGAGFMGKTHAQRLTKSGQASVEAICSQPLETAQRLSDEVTGGKARVFEDLMKMLEQVKLDALYVCLPPFAHDGQVEAAAGKGIHLFLEKPLALTVERAQSMVSAIERAGVVSMMGYHMRFAPPVRKLKAMIERGSAGRPALMQAAYLCNALHGAWWRDVKRCGGQALEQVIHLYDMALHLLGAAKTVSAPASFCTAVDPAFRPVGSVRAAIRMPDESTSAHRALAGAVAAASNNDRDSRSAAIERTMARNDPIGRKFTRRSLPRQRQVPGAMPRRRSRAAGHRGDQPPLNGLPLPITLPAWLRAVKRGSTR
jgi:predicted dehydrogenase